jgi:hypothetical protein
LADALDYKGPASCLDWTQHLGRDSEMEMNSHSYATLAAVEESVGGSSSAALKLKDTSESSGCWPFVFDSSFQQNSQKDLFPAASTSNAMVDPSYLERAPLISDANNNGTGLFFTPKIPSLTNQIPLYSPKFLKIITIAQYWTPSMP